MIALIVFGPRKLPEMAKKLGSMMSEFRKVSGDFRSTWEDAVNLEELDDTKKIEKSTKASEVENKIGDNKQLIEAKNTNGNSELPEVKKLSKAEFDSLVSEKKTQEIKTPRSEKTDWL